MVDNLINNTDRRAIPEEFSRTAIILGDDAVSRLMDSRVAIFGIGGVGGYAAEALCRAGVGTLILIDGDVVSRSNINRQIIATQESVGISKTLAMAQRIASINPAANVIRYDTFYAEDTADEIDLAGCGCVIDAIDTVGSKLLLIERMRDAGIPLISCMGAGNKLDPSRFEAADIYDTDMCPLARVMRKECRRRGIESLRVIYSREEAVAPVQEGEARHSGRPVPGSAAFCVGAAGLLAAAECVKILLGSRG